MSAMGNEFLFQYFLSGITKGSIYAIVAIGFNLIYSATGVLNFAQGEFVMLGGMIAVTLAFYVPLPIGACSNCCSSGASATTPSCTCSSSPSACRS
jgi:branched-subunit amino acid ABC-type transport system permease component